MYLTIYTISKQPRHLDHEIEKINEKRLEIVEIIELKHEFAIVVKVNERGIY